MSEDSSAQAKHEEDRRRLKIVSLEESLLIDVFNWWRNPPHFLALPITDEIPEDAKVVRVFHSWDRMCIEAIIHSATFPPAKDGEQLERIPGFLTEFRTIPFSKVSRQVSQPKENE